MKEDRMPVAALIAIVAAWLLAINGVIDPLWTKAAVLFCVVLILWAWRARRASMPGEKPLILLALALSVVADALLAFSQTLPGIGTFLVAQALFFGAYLTRAHFGARWWPYGLYGLLAAGFMIFLLPHVSGIMTVAVIAYAVVITLMAAQAAVAWLAGPPYLRRYWRLSGIGAGLFFASDCLLGYKMFVADFAWSDTIIMGLYLTSQVLAVLSLPRMHDCAQMPATSRGGHCIFLHMDRLGYCSE